MPNEIGSDWELLHAVQGALESNYEVERVKENVHLASVIGNMADGSGIDLLIPAGTAFEVKQNADRLVDPDECPVGFVAMVNGPITPIGPTSATGEAAQTFEVYLYVTDTIEDDEVPPASHNLTETELDYMGRAYAVAVILTLRRLGPGSMWTYGAGIAQPILRGNVVRAYDVDGDYNIRALQIHQTWSTAQIVRY